MNFIFTKFSQCEPTISLTNHYVAGELANHRWSRLAS